MFSNTLSQGYVLKSKLYNYRIEKVLGQGAFGITYLARIELQGGLGSLESSIHVTIKEFFMKEICGREGTSVTSSASSKGGLFYEYKEKFAREAKNLSKLKHPNIVNVMEFFEANNTCYYVMEYLSGGDLDSLIERRGRLSEADTLRYTRQIAEALSFMHGNKMLHLDLKPKNVMLNADGDAILIDFGLSKQYDKSGEPESSTTVGRGTPGYAPLEQANYQDGHGFPVTMDVYALGATMYKMLTGKRAPEASVILNEGFPRETMQSQGISSQIIDLVNKAMNPLKKDRYQQVSQLLNALDWEEQEETIIDKHSKGKTKNAKHVTSKTTVLKPKKYAISLTDKSIWFLLICFLLFLLSSCSIEWYDPLYAIGGVAFVGLLTLISLLFKKFEIAILYGGILIGLLLLYLLNLSWGLYCIIGAGVLIVLYTIASYNKRNRWIISVLILLGSIFNSYVWYSRNILQGHNNNKAIVEPKDTTTGATRVLEGSEKQEGNIFSEEDTQSFDGETNGYKWIDLGLPSGLKWAACNVGAETPRMVGDYYAWGETSTRSSYTENNKYYYSDKGLNRQHDVASKKMGHAWSIPSVKDFEELINNCEYKVDEKGAVFVGKNGHKLYFPFSGTKYDNKVDNGNGDNICNTPYWTSTPWITDDVTFHNSGAKTFSLWKDHAEIDQLAAFHGLNVRAVTK